jgi:hypothetical protein
MFSRTVVSDQSSDLTGLTDLTVTNHSLPDNVISMILRMLPLGRVLATRAVSKHLNAIVTRLFSTASPNRRICLNEILTRETGIWGIGGPEHRALSGLRELLASGGPVVVYIVAQATKEKSKQVYGFPTHSQTEVLTNPTGGFLSRDDQIHIFLKPGVFIEDKWNFDRLAQFSRNLVSFAVQPAKLKIWQISLLRKTTFTEDLRSLCLEGVSLPLHVEGESSRSRRTDKSKKDATNEMRLLLAATPGLTALNLERTGLALKPLVSPLCLMKDMADLNLSDLRDADPGDLATVVSHMTELRSLKLRYIPSMPQCLADALFSVPLVNLALIACGITDTSTLRSAALLGTGRSSIETLDLRWNNLSSADDISALLAALPVLREIDLQETIRDQDELVSVFISRPSVKANLSFPLDGRLAVHDVRNAITHDNILWWPLDSGL